MRYAVETLMGSSWENCWHEDDELLTFATREEAEAELEDHLETMHDCCATGDLSDSMSREDFRIVEVED